MATEDQFEIGTNVALGESTPVEIARGSAGAGYYAQFEYTDLLSYEMTAPVHLKVYGKESTTNAVVLIGFIDFRFTDYLTSRLNNPGSTSEAYLDFYADILTYGASSQKYMKYHTDYLATADNDSSYGTQELPTTFTNVSSVKTGVAITPNVVVGNKVMFRLRFTNSTLPSGTDLNGLTMSIKYTDATVNETTLSVENSMLEDVGGYGLMTQYEFASLPCLAINDYFEVELKDANNTVIGTLKYSFEEYAKARYDAYKELDEAEYDTYDDTTKSQYDLRVLSQAIVAYGRTARIAFGS